MPLYVFICPTCRDTIEVLQAYSASPPLCRSTDHPFGCTVMERTIAASAIRISDPPEIRTTRRDGMRVTTTDRRPRRERA